VKRQTNPLGVPQVVGGSDNAQPRHNTGAADRAFAFDYWLVRKVASAMGDPPLTFKLWNGDIAYQHADESVGTITFSNRRALFGVIIAPELGFGDGYSAGSIEIDGELVEVLTRGFGSIENAGPKRFKRSMIGRQPSPESNTHAGSRRHIAHHYDLGNDFYRLWLDEQMVYTCAYYPSLNATLEQAQLAKMHHVARKLRLRPGMHVVEAGCGWGELALHMAQHYGVTVRAYNISKQQIFYARQRAKEAGLEQQVQFIEDDYRNMSGQYDAFVSVGMLEHVGIEQYAQLGEVVQRSLAPHGLALIHSVGRNRPTAVNAWLEKRIFPGSYPPSLSEMMSIFEPCNFSILDVENLRLHYARTLQEWLTRFDAQIDTIAKSYDDYFIRAWRLYLAGCAAAFSAGSIQLFQIVFAHPRHNELALTRRHLYEDHAVDQWRQG
jgi:cyclopropane-fatty-acyl-phospholipid synthase